ncbi:hypothetical protein DY000_02020543 [Brassica cretica]|uniref:Uncharacterized protein n=1 Tax=Brassica cretica TaxID=69181 RepID=A0ABQ7EJ56_BRACR|nr:hypothetical protein DY000_02020543 [Brassica cretica]
MDCMASSLLENICSGWEIHTCSRVRCLQNRHGPDLSPESTLLVTCRVEGLVLVSELGYLALDAIELPLELGFSRGSFG